MGCICRMGTTLKHSKGQHHKRDLCLAMDRLQLLLLLQLPSQQGNACYIMCCDTW
jgi:hypothetical protein